MAGMNGPDRKPWLHGRCESLRVDTNFNAAVINGFDLPGQALIDLTEIQNGPDFGIVRLTDDGAGVGRFTSSALVDADIPGNIARDPVGLGFATRDAPNTPLALRAIVDADIPPNIVRDPIGLGFATRDVAGNPLALRAIAIKDIPVNIPYKQLDKMEDLLKTGVTGFYESDAVSGQNGTSDVFVDVADVREGIIQYVSDPTRDNKTKMSLISPASLRAIADRDLRTRDIAAGGTGEGIFKTDGSGNTIIGPLTDDEMKALLPRRGFITSVDDGSGNGTNKFEIRQINSGDITPANDGYCIARAGAISFQDIALSDVKSPSSRGIVSYDSVGNINAVPGTAGQVWFATGAAPISRRLALGDMPFAAPNTFLKSTGSSTIYSNITLQDLPTGAANTVLKSNGLVNSFGALNLADLPFSVSGSFLKSNGVSATYAPFALSEIPSGAVNTTLKTSPLGQVAWTLPTLSTKGDIFVRDATGDARLPISNVDGAILRVNPLTSTGLEWHGTLNTVKTVLGETAGFNASVACTAFGRRALQNMTTGNNNTAIGDGSLRTLTTSGANTAIGFSALGGAVNPSSCTAVGAFCGGGGTANVTVGSFNGVTLSTGVQNVVVGDQAFVNGNGSRNTIMGYGAFNMVAGNASNFNIAIGHSSMSDASSIVSQNIAIGSSSLPTSQGLSNICIGANSGGTLFGGNSNILIGGGAGSALAGNASGNIILGNLGGVSGANNTTFIANVRGTGVASGVPVVVGLNNEIGIAPSSKRFKANIVDIKTLSTTDRFAALKPVGYNYKSDEKKRQQFGLIAEDVYNLFPEMVAMGAPEDFEPQVQDTEIYDEKLSIEERNAKINLKRKKSEKLVPFAIRYEQLIPLLIAEVQDLRNILISAGLIKSK